MFYSLTGKLVHMEPGVVAIECGGVAFKCFTSMNTQKNMPRIGETATRLRAHAADGRQHLVAVQLAFCREAV